MTPMPTPEPLPLVPLDFQEIDIAPPGWTWRKGQWELAERIAASPKKIVILEAEPGTGKSTIPLAAGRALGKRVTILVQNKQLQRQYLRDFSARARTMMGRSEFKCNLTGGNAAFAPCVVGSKCDKKGSWQRGRPMGTPACDYYKAKATAYTAQVRVLNYAYYLNEIKAEFSTFAYSDWIVCDEAHDLEPILMDHAVIGLERATLHNLDVTLPRGDLDFDRLKNWAIGANSFLTSNVNEIIAKLVELGVPISIDGDERVQINLTAELTDIANTEEAQELFRELRQTNQVVELTQKVIAASYRQADWVIDTTQDSVLVKPIFGRDGFQQILDTTREKLVLMSAFLAPEMLIQTLGIDPEQCEIIRAPRVWDRSGSKIYYCPVAKFSYNTPQNVWNWTAGIVDSIIRHFTPKKGLVHVPSVQLRDLILNRTKLRHLFVAYDAKSRFAKYPTKDQAIQMFKDKRGQAVLLGQSISTGLDIPYDPEWQVIIKLAFMPTNDPAIKARMAVDKFFYPYRTICEIVQATGRVKRAEDHDGPTIILDKNFGWFYAANKAYFPSWFTQYLVWNGWEAFPEIDQFATRSGVLNGVMRDVAPKSTQPVRRLRG